MKLYFGIYLESDQRIPAIGVSVFLHEPFYFYSIQNDDGSFKQCGTHKSIELQVLIGRTILYLAWHYKAVTLPRKFPTPRRPGHGTKP